MNTTIIYCQKKVRILYFLHTILLNECLYISIELLSFDRIDVSEETDVNKTSIATKECGTCHYWYFLKKTLNFNQISPKDAMTY